MKINSIFRSIDGEVNQWGQGTLTTFVRLQGCNLACKYCDTEYARDMAGGTEIEVEKVAELIKDTGAKKITITGGEPYIQLPSLDKLLDILLASNAGMNVSIETNGTYKPRWAWPSHIMDYKLPSSGMTKHMDYSHFLDLMGCDFVKFVVMDKEDFAMATHVKKDLQLNGCRARFAFSPVYNELDSSTLLAWMYEGGLQDSVLNVQLHKLLDVL